MQTKYELTPIEKEFFIKNGYLGPIKLYDPEDARLILRDIRKKSYDKSKAIFNNDVYYDRHFDISELTQHIGNPIIIEKLRGLMGNDILAWRSEYHAKFPGSSGTEWHQVKDYRFASGKPQLEPTCLNTGMPHDLTVWTTFTEATKTNGCLKFMPGTQLKLYFDESKPLTNSRKREENYTSVESGTSFYGYRFADFKIDPNWEPKEEDAVYLEMQPGECVIFSGMCMHGSAPNTTKRETRFAIGARYAPTHVRIYPDQTEFRSHGGYFDLEQYGAVLVSGEDKFKHNRLRDTNNHGEKFPYLTTISENRAKLLG